LGYYAASSGSFLPTFRDNPSVPSAFFISILGPLKSGPIDFPETSARNYRYSLRNNPEERSSQNNYAAEAWIPLLRTYPFCIFGEWNATRGSR